MVALPLTACSKEPAAPAKPAPAVSDAPGDTPDAAAPTDAVEPLLIDVRSQEERDEGHIESAVFIPHDQIGDKIAGVTTDKDRPIYLHCKSGGRAGKAKTALEGMGYTNVTNLGGLDDARKHFEQQ